MTTSVRELTKDWGEAAEVDLYLERCQHDTPDAVVKRVWKMIAERRTSVVKAVDFGAGDGRFATHGKYDEYIGYEIDPNRARNANWPKRAKIVHSCAFSSKITDACVAIGNPPFVRNQDLPIGWRDRAARIVAERTGVRMSGLANAWQHFAFLSLASTRSDGLVVLVMPYEWVSRPSARALREYIGRNAWAVEVYRLSDRTFGHVLTTASITVIDKSATAQSASDWKYFEQRGRRFMKVGSPTGAVVGVIEYTRPRAEKHAPFARRGLSPGTQSVLVLTDDVKQKHKLRARSDVVRCVTSLRPMSADVKALTQQRFDRLYRDAGQKCWLIRTDRKPSKRLRAYLDQVPNTLRQSRTCTIRDDWWRFQMPVVPRVIVATGFSGARPKSVRNEVRALAVGSVSGVYGLTDAAAERVVDALHVARFSSRIVAHSNGLKKVEVGQLETFLRRKRSSLV